MSRYIDADALIKKVFPYDVADPKCYSINAKAVYEEIRRSPTADVVEVVRCKDCKHLTVINNGSAYARCEKTGYVFLPFRTDTREHFCAYGERSKNDT